MDKNKLNLGCGYDIKKGYINLDCKRLNGVDIVHNLEDFPWPFKDNFFDEVYCSHVLEHVNDIVKTMEEIYRISKNKARIKILAPYFAGHGAFNDPTHKNFITFKTFDYFQKKHYYSTSRFKILKKRVFFFSNNKFFNSPFYSKIFDFFINLSPVFYQRFISGILSASEIDFLLEVNKVRQFKTHQ